MYANKPKSRIAREFFYILNSLKDHYKSLLRMRDEDPVLIGRLLTLLSIYMLREEGLKTFRRQDVIRETQLPRSSVYKIIGEFTERGILEETLGEYKCLSHTPEFLLNPEELYGRPMEVVKDGNQIMEEQVREVLLSLRREIPAIIKAELSNITVTTPPITIPSDEAPLGTIRTVPKKIPKVKDLLDEVDEPEDDKKKDLEEEMEDLFL